MAASSKQSGSKYKSLDDILEALKDESIEEDTDPKSTQAKLEKSAPLAKSLEGPDPLDNEDILDEDIEVEGSEEVEDKDDFDDLDDHSDKKPKLAKKDLEDKPEDKPEYKSEEVDEETVDNSDAYSELKSKYAEENPAPKYDRWSSYPDYPEGEDGDKSVPNPVESPAHYETNLNDLAEESISNQPTPASEGDNFAIRRLKPQMNSNFAPQQNMSTSGGYSQNREQNFSDSRFNYPLQEKNSNKKWKVLILSLIGLLTIGVVVFLLKNQYIPFIGQDSAVVISSPEPSPTSTPEPTPTPVPELARSEFKLRVLNGTTTTGLAGSASAALKSLGYQIERTGNNSNQNIAQTTISVKSGDASLAAQLVRDLSTKFDATISGTALSQSDPADALIVLGAK